MTYRLVQGDDTYDVEALSSTKWTAEEFYSYGHPDGASANTPWDLERENTSQLFFYDGPDTVSLVFIHDEPNTNSGGYASFSLTGLSENGEWVVTDDSGDGNYGYQNISWGWAPCCTDGGVFQGGLTDDFEITLDPDFNSGINRWIVRSGSPEDSIELDLDEPITITTRTSVSASVTTLQFIPGKEENVSRGGHPLSSGLMQIFPEDGYIDGGSLFEVELPTGPILDSWIGGDMTEDLPMGLEEAYQKKESKYLDTFPDQEFNQYRFENGIGVSFETTEDGGVNKDSVEIEFSESGESPDDPKISLGGRENSMTVFHDHDINGIPVEEWYGNHGRRSNRKPRYYQYDTDFEFEGTEGVRVLTVSGGYAGFVQDISRRVGDDLAGFFTEIWDWDDVSRSVAELAMLKGGNEIQLLFDYLTVVPNTYSVIDFIVLADGRRYVRVWDASQYPSLAVYVDGERKSLEKMPYEPRELINMDMLAFHVLASAGATPYTSPLNFYKRLLDNPELTRALVESAMDSGYLSGYGVSELLPTIPRETIAFQSKDGKLVENPEEPFDSAAGLLFPLSGEVKPE